MGKRAPYQGTREASVRWTSYKVCGYVITREEKCHQKCMVVLQSPARFKHFPLTVTKSSALLFFFFVDVFPSQPEPKAFIVQMHRAAPRSVFCELWRTGKRTRLNITCSRQRWFQEKRGPDVYEARPSRGSRGGVGTGPFPSSHSPVGCPCEREEGRMLGQGYLWEWACYWLHVLQNWDDGRLIKPLQIKYFLKVT